LTIDFKAWLAELTPRHAYRFCILVMLPFLVGLWVLPHTTYADGQLLGTPDQNQSGSSQSVTYTFTHNSSAASLPESIDEVFPLADYLDFPPFVSHTGPLICFQDEGSYVILPDGSNFTPNFDWDVQFGNSTTLDIPPNSFKCARTVPGQTNSYQWYARMDIDMADQNLTSNLTFVPKTTTYPRFVIDYGLLQGLVMIPVCYLFIWYPAAGIWKKVHKGLGEQ